MVLPNSNGKDSHLAMKKVVDFYARHFRAILVAGFMLTILSGWIASGLTLDADLERLLPESAPSVQGLRELEKSYGVVGRVSIVVESSSPEKVEKAIEELSVSLLKVKRIERAEVERPVSFFKKNRLLYIDKVDLETLSKRVKKRLKWEKQRANPLFIDLGGSKKPEVKFDDIEKKYTSMSQGARYCNEEKTECVFFLFPNFSSNDLKASTTLNEDLAAKIAEYRKSNSDVKLGLTGRYKKRIDQTDALMNDLVFGTGLAIFLLLVFLLVYFRGFKTSLVVFIPLVVGTFWSFAFARLTFGSLNILTGFFGAVLLGLGIDYGIHIVSRYVESREKMDVEEALVDTLSSAGRASLYAGMTTVIAFGSLMVSDFVAFYEYGAIALGGITLIVLANMTILPCLLLATAKYEIRLKPTISVTLSERFVGIHGWIKTRQKLLLVVFAILVVLFSFGVSKVSFEHDFSRIQTTNLDSWRLDETVDTLLDVTQVPAVFLVDTAEQAENVATILRQRKRVMKEGWTIDKVITLKDVLPKDQNAKIDILKDLKKRFDALPKKAIKGEVLDFQKEIQDLLDKGPLGFSALPPSIRAPLSRTTENGQVVVVFTAISHHDSEQMAALAKVIRGVDSGKGKKIDGINDSLLLVDIMAAVEKDSAMMFGITLLGLLLVAIFAFRKLKPILLLLLTIGLATLFAFGATGLFEIKFNFINMLIVPIWIGLGVDAGFHLMVRSAEAPRDTKGFLATAFAVSAAFITSMIGFGSMLITDHGGLFSMGLIASVGLGTIFLVSFFVQLIAFKGERD